MTEEKITDFFLKLTEQLSALNANMKTVLDRLANHETRLLAVEQKKDGDWKTQLMMLLAKAVVVGGVTIASLAGAGGLLKEVLK